jgi:hypothetical protein
MEVNAYLNTNLGALNLIRIYMMHSIWILLFWSLLGQFLGDLLA